MIQQDDGRILSLPSLSHYHSCFLQSLIHIRLFVTPWTTASQASLSITIYRSLLKLMSTESGMSSNNFVPCHHLLLLFSVFPNIRVFSNESALCIRWPSIKYWSFTSVSVVPMNIEGWFPLNILAVQGSLKSLLQCPSLKASILWLSSFFMVQLSYSYMISGKIIALTRQTFVSKVMSLLFNTLSRLAIAFLPRSKCSLISWLSHHL